MNNDKANININIMPYGQINLKIGIGYHDNLTECESFMHFVEPQSTYIQKTEIRYASNEYKVPESTIT